MGFFKRLSSLLTGGRGGSDDRYVDIYALSRRCREPVAGKVDLFNEVSQAESDSGHSYYARKVLHTSGVTRCFDQVEVEIWLDGKKRLADHQVTGGRWLDAEEYEEELALFNAPPEDDDAVEPDAVEGAQENTDDQK